MQCKNCQTEIQESDDFCSACGGRIIRNRLTLRNLFEHFSEQFLNYDNKFLKTIIYLIKKPEYVIGSYIDGTRKKYVNPISFFAISLTISGLYLFILQKFFPDAIDFSNIYTDQNQLKISTEVSNSIFDYNSLFYFALIPVLGLISFVLFLKHKYNFTEHVVIYLYTMSLGSIFMSFLSLIILFIKPEIFLASSILSNVLLIGYHCYLLKRIFELSGLQIVLKTVVFLVIFFILYLAVSILMFLAMFLFTDLSIQDFAPKK